jgi:hypothetical protein
MTVIDATVVTTRHRLRRRMVAGTVATGVLALAGAGFAYWSLTGSGSGSAEIADGAAQLEIDVTVDGELHPGAASTVTYSVTNPAGFDVPVGTISLAADSLGADASGCDADWFELTDAVLDRTVTAGGTTTATATLRFLDPGVNQDACKGATLSFDVVSD